MKVAKNIFTGFLNFMKVDSNNSYPRFNNSFSGKVSDINKLKDIYKIVDKNFPYFSPSKSVRMHAEYIAKNEKLLKYWKKKNAAIGVCRDKVKEYELKPELYYPNLFEEIHKIKAVNCREQSRMGYLALRLNGIDTEDCHYGVLSRENGNDIDHVFNIIEGENDVYVMDIQHGIVETVQKALEIYSSPRFSKVFKIKEWDILGIEKYNTLKISDNTLLDKFKKLFPNLVLENKKNKT